MSVPAFDSNILRLIGEIHLLRPLLSAVVLLIAGPALHLYAPRHRSRVEERVKNRRMTEAEARWHLRFFHFWAPTLTVLGVAQTGLLLVSLLQ